MRGYVIGKKDIELEHLEEAYTTEHWLVRIYKVKKPSNRPNIKYTERQILSNRTKTSYPKKVCVEHHSCFPVEKLVGLTRKISKVGG